MNHSKCHGLLADPGKARGAALQTPLSLTKYITLCPPMALRRRQVQAVRDDASSHKNGYVAQLYGILNIKQYHSGMIWSKSGGVFAE